MGARYAERDTVSTADMPAMAVMESALVLSVSSPVAGKRVRLTFNSGRLTSDAGVLVLAEIERHLGIAERLARCLEDPRSPGRVHHTLAEMIRFRVLLIAAGYPDANDCDALRTDPAFKMALGPTARERGGLVFPADHTPARELARRGGAQAHDGGYGRAVLRQLDPLDRRRIVPA